MSNKISIIEKRKHEIIEYIVSNEFNLATSRIMDFSKEFSTQEKVNESIVYKQQYNSLNEEIRQLGGKTLEDTRKLQRLSRSLLEFLDIIVDEYTNNNIYKDFSEKNFKTVDSSKSIPFTEREKAKMVFLLDKNQEKNLNNNNHVLCKCKGLSKVYKNKSIGFQLYPIDLEVKAGEILALVGENGNGKTTLLNLISGELLKTRGEIKYSFLSNKNIDLTDYYLLKQQIAYIKQDLPIWHGSLKNNLHFIASVNGIYGQQNIDDVEFIIHRLGLEKQISNNWNTLSGGYKMRFSLAKALIWNPKLLILDEPLANLDMKSQQFFLKELKFLVEDQRNPISIIITTQQIYEVEAIADKIIFLSNGKAIYNGYIRDFPKNSEYNTFELKCNLIEDELKSMLKKIKVNSIKISGSNYIIKAPSNISEKIFLLYLLQYSKKIRVEYFRDISSSTRTLFKEENEF